MQAPQAVLLVAHGTVDTLDELPEFLANIRRGHAPPPELVAEVRRRYVAIGGSPLNTINRALARKLEAKLGLPVRLANRLARPATRDVLAELATIAPRVAVVPLAQYSAHVYAEHVRAVAAEIAPSVALAFADDWGQRADLVAAFAKRARAALEGLPRDKTTVIISAHSLPVAVVRAGDPYEREVRAAAAALAGSIDARTVVAFQSQGMSAPGARPVEWLGPDLPSTLDAIAARGDTHVVVAPIGFLADHVEILYDLDVEARSLAAARGIVLTRTASLDADDDFVDVLAGVARPLLALG